MSTPSTQSNLIERLFKAGAHFGFKKSRRHPTVSRYLFTTKQGNDIIDLEQTATQIEAAKAALRAIGAAGKTVVFVGTKEEAHRAIVAAATKAKAPYVINRWIGGMFTNWTEIKKRLNRMAELTRERESGELDRKYTKKERVILGREASKLEFYFGGIATITKVPDMMVVVDPRHDKIAVAEARDMKVPIVAVMSSDCDTKVATYPVIVNDALQTSVTAVLEELVAAYLEGQSQQGVAKA